MLGKCWASPAWPHLGLAGHARLGPTWACPAYAHNGQMLSKPSRDQLTFGHLPTAQWEIYPQNADKNRNCKFILFPHEKYENNITNQYF